MLRARRDCCCAVSKGTAHWTAGHGRNSTAKYVPGASHRDFLRQGLKHVYSTPKLDLQGAIDCAGRSSCAGCVVYGYSMCTVCSGQSAHITPGTEPLGRNVCVAQILKRRTVPWLMAGFSRIPKSKLPAQSLKSKAATYSKPLVRAHPSEPVNSIPGHWDPRPARGTISPIRSLAAG
jgi:hypothetical protein